MQSQSDTKENFRTAVLRRNRAEVEGSGGKAMILVHDLGYDQHRWRFVAPAFLDEFTVIQYDLTATIAAIRKCLTAEHLAQTKQ